MKLINASLQIHWAKQQKAVNFHTFKCVEILFKVCNLRPSFYSCLCWYDSRYDSRYWYKNWYDSSSSSSVMIKFFFENDHSQLFNSKMFRQENLKIQE